MTSFVKEKFQDDGMYVNYDGKFVARFKYARGGKASFIKFLIKNFTVEEYFGLLESGNAPLQIAESKGYLLPHIKKALKTGGYSLDKAGFKKMIQDQIDARRIPNES
jgi:hypothetical protein